MSFQGPSEDKPRIPDSNDNIGLELSPNDPDLLSKVADTYETWHVGERGNSLLIFLACLSKNLNREHRIHVIVIGESSSGKSHLLATVIRPWKKLDLVIDLTRFTTAYLERLDNIDGKIMLFQQMRRHRGEGQDPMINLKFLLSEGKLTLGYVDMNAPKEERRKESVVEGVPVFLSTSVEVDIDPETLNRVFQTAVDESQDQNKQIVDYQLTQSSISGLNRNKAESDAEMGLYQLTTNYSGIGEKIFEIVIPFAHQLKSSIPIGDVKIRRDLPKILNLTKVITFVHYPLRKSILREDSLGREKLTLFSEPQDLYEAMSIGGPAIRQTFTNVTDKALQILKVANEELEFKDPEENYVLAKEIAVKVEMSTNRTRELLNSLDNAGYLTSQRKGREKVFSPGSKKLDEILEADIHFSDQDFLSWFERNYPGEELRTPSVSSCYAKELGKGTIDRIVAQNVTIGQTEPSLSSDATTRTHEEVRNKEKIGLESWMQ